MVWSISTTLSPDVSRHQLVEDLDFKIRTPASPPTFAPLISRLGSSPVVSGPPVPPRPTDRILPYRHPIVGHVVERPGASEPGWHERPPPDENPTATGPQGYWRKAKKGAGSVGETDSGRRRPSLMGYLMTLMPVAFWPPFTVDFGERSFSVRPEPARCR